MPTAQSQPPAIPAALAAEVLAFSRALVAAVRARVMYSATHPTAVAAAERCRAVVGRLALAEGVVLGVTPNTLLINGEPLVADVRVKEASALLNDRDILSLRFIAPPAEAEFAHFLALLTADCDAIRARGGPATVWEGFDHYWLRIDQIDYDLLLAPAPDGAPSVAADRPADVGQLRSAVVRDRIWESLVRSISDGRRQFDESGERRLLQIAQSADAICALASDAAAAQGTGDTAALKAAQAATVLMTFQRLVSFVEQRAPERVAATLDQVARAASRIDAGLLMRVVSEAAESGVGADLITAISAHFNDDQIADLLAAAMAAEGKATGRVAAALTALTPDPDRRGRVLRMARSRATDRQPARGSAVSTAWQALEQFLDGPPDAAYVSKLYGESLDQAGARSHKMRLDAPAKLDEWLQSVSAESVRTLSATVLLDLFSLEQHPGALVETAQDLAVLTDDLLLAGDTTEAARIVEALRLAATGSDPHRANAAQRGIDDALRSTALREAACAAGDLDPRAFDDFERLCAHLGPRVLDMLLSAFVELPDCPSRTRLEHAIASFQDDAVVFLSRALADADAEHGRVLAHLMRQLGTALAVAALQAVTRNGRPDHVRAAIHELVTIEGPGAERALGELLRSGPTNVRLFTIDALTGSHHPKASSLLAGALDDARALARDHGVAMRLLAALRLVGDEDAVPSVVRAMRLRRWIAPRRTARLTRLAVAVLQAMRAPAAARALDEAVAAGDVVLRRAARGARQGRG